MRERAIVIAGMAAGSVVVDETASSGFAGA
jgi:hypothetical protein